MPAPHFAEGWTMTVPTLERRIVIVTYRPFTVSGDPVRFTLGPRVWSASLMERKRRKGSCWKDSGLEIPERRTKKAAIKAARAEWGENVPISSFVDIGAENL